MADDEIMDRTVSELELYRRQMFLDFNRALSSAIVGIYNTAPKF